MVWWRQHTDFRVHIWSSVRWELSFRNRRKHWRMWGAAFTVCYHGFSQFKMSPCRWWPSGYPLHSGPPLIYSSGRWNETLEIISDISPKLFPKSEWALLLTRRAQSHGLRTREVPPFGVSGKGRRIQRRDIHETWCFSSELDPDLKRVWKAVFIEHSGDR